MLDEIVGILGCPVCRGAVSLAGERLTCTSCGAGYPLVDGVPYLLRETVDGEALRSNRVTVEESGWVRTAKRLISVPSPTLETAELKRRLPEFIRGFSAEAKIVNVGSASLRYRPDILNVDLIPGPGVDVVGDATRLPFRDASLDGIISRRVLEHVRKPQLAVAEMHRVLRPGGKVWCEIPFMQGYHPTPTDFQRFTTEGMADLFDGFTVRELGVALGPSSTLSWVLREYLAILFSFNNPYLYKIGERVFSWLTLPVKYLDVITSRSKFASQIASSLYVVVERP